MEESQRKAVCWMWYNLFDACRGGILADSMANNLVQVTQFMHGLCLPGLVFKCLLIVPTQCVDLWVSALLQLAPRVRVAEFVGPNRSRKFEQVLQLGGIVVTSYGVAMSDIIPRMGGDDANMTDEDNIWDLIVFDQAERLKDATSKTNATLSRLQANINLLLTSHPLPKHPKDLYTLFDFTCEADLFGSYDHFKDRFEHPISRSLGKRADDMDRQLAAVARLQMMGLIDSQYWQNWSELMTPGGSKRQEVLPAFVSTPTPFKDRTNAITYGTDPTSTPSFSKTKSGLNSKTKKTTSSDLLSTPITSTKGKKKNNQHKALIPEIINLDGDDSGAIALDDLEASISALSFGSSDPLSTGMSMSSISTESWNEKATDLHSTPLSTKLNKRIGGHNNEPSPPTRRTPIRNAVFSNLSATSPVSSRQENIGSAGEAGLYLASPASSMSPNIAQTRQRLSFGRISLLDENEDDEDTIEDIFEDDTLTLSSSRTGGTSSTPAKKDVKKSLVAKEWSSTETFLRKREAFALELFAELNSVIFGARLPKLPLVWRKMKNCAGIYHFKDSSITLSKTLLTNSARLTSTLAHEMAHAATHLLDACPNDRHGPVWQKWARIGRARYPTVVTGSVYHNYCSQNMHPDGQDGV